ncbi:hypothetical protein FQN54_000336 [Arachnomyces sp. PD_36]|nr:hypothetical protein FQN54_000336 [Arachnomyces sp. PD_36]
MNRPGWLPTTPNSPWDSGDDEERGSTELVELCGSGGGVRRALDRVLAPSPSTPRVTNLTAEVGPTEAKDSRSEAALAPAPAIVTSPTGSSSPGTAGN